MHLPDYDPLDERWRYCIHCNADCWPEPEHQHHTPDCPTTTGLHPVTTSDIHPYGMGCTRCPTTFAEGDSYLLIQVDHATWECVCIGCAAHTVMA